MVTRYTTALGGAAAVTVGLLVMMQSLIATGVRLDLSTPVARLVDYVHVDRPAPSVTIKRQRPPPPPRAAPAPPSEPLAEGHGPRVQQELTPTDPTTQWDRNLGPWAMDGELIPIVTVAPSYPGTALASNIEGYVVVEYVVTANGSVRDVRVVESSHAVFERAALDAAEKFRYRPRVVNGEPVEVYGVKRRITFVIDD